MSGANGSLHGDELDEDLRCNLDTRVAREEAGKLFLLVPRHQLDRIMTLREGAQDIYQRVAGNDGLVGIVEGALGMVLENVVEFLFEVGDGLAVPSICFRLHGRVSRVTARGIA